MRAPSVQISNPPPVGERIVIRRPFACDGDTIDGILPDGGIHRFRLANIDAPETGENAKCHRERMAGEYARQEASALLRAADEVAVRCTSRPDKYGRIVAYVFIDNRDLGETLVKRGLALPWRGKRERWCGRHGGLAKMAQQRQAEHHCTACLHWATPVSQYD